MINILILRQLFEYAKRLCSVRTSNSHQKTRLVSEHRLNFVVRQTRQIFGVDERVTAAVQPHLTVHLRTRIYYFVSPKYLDNLKCSYSLICLALRNT